jgi:hypothetical protein
MMGWVGIWFGTLEHPSMSTEASLAVILLVWLFLHHFILLESQLDQLGAIFC